MELGLNELSSPAYTYIVTISGMPTHKVALYTIYDICKNFVCSTYSTSVEADHFMKERISSIEIAFRQRANELADARALVQQRRELAKRQNSPHYRPSAADVALYFSDGNEDDDTNWRNFQDSVNELNERMRLAGYNLNYHNGLIQISTDPLIQKHIEAPFWLLVSDAK
jgi:hypothetical protein